jgi:hypothetical protein
MGNRKPERNGRACVAFAESSRVLCCIPYKGVWAILSFMGTQRLEDLTSMHLMSGCCLNYKKTVQTSFSSKMELRVSGTWIKICLDV